MPNSALGTKRLRRADEKIAKLEEEIKAESNLIGRQVHEKFSGAGKFKGLVHRQSGADFIVEYDDGDSQTRKERQIRRWLVDRDDEDQDVLSKLRAQGDENQRREGAEGQEPEENAADAVEEESTQPFSDIEDDAADDRAGWADAEQQSVDATPPEEGE